MNGHETPKGLPPAFYFGLTILMLVLALYIFEHL